MDNTLEARASASPPAQLDDEAPRQLPPLPEEIIHHIIKLAYPPRSLTNGLQRRHFLHRILLVNKSWHRLAKRELYRHLWLEKDEEVSEMLASQTRDDQQLPTRSVTVAKGDLTITMLRRLLGASSGLRSFCYLSESWVSRRVGLQLLAELAPSE
ncbi:hypothetical protein BCR35DRAFT_3539 [Leucosporidium creatinivorum]|uniref:F-box domain-containing protein n=1 Tax=Leucosporidium creatinivorum TaxID=106004 RepID=A0A1Y2G3N7_9BASI|nr:hypothetical protein BCR35DRAFT_3539 [Leucosporidium creatinivorum]